MSNFIWQKGNVVMDLDPNDSTYTVWSTTPEIAKRLMSGERPASWDMLVLPDRAKLHELTSGSELWQHISQYAPGAATLLYIALTSSSQLNQAVVVQNIQDMMRLVVAQLGTDHALHSTPSSKMVNDPNDPEGLPIPVGTLADELSQILSDSFFPFSYADLM